MTRTVSDDALHCSFCGKGSHDVAKLVAGPGVFICDECVRLCNDIVARELAAHGAGGAARTPGAPVGEAAGQPALTAWETLSDEDLLAEMARAHGAHENVDRAVALHVSALRARGVSWARIGDALGMTRQSAWERFSGEE